MAKSILIIEDDEFLLGLEKDKLEKAGYKVFTAINSVQAFEALNIGTQLDMILLDLLLPEVDGFMILEKLRENKITKDIPVIVFSNLSEEKDIERANKFHINEYIVKSNISLNDLVEKVKKLLGE